MCATHTHTRTHACTQCIHIWRSEDSGKSILSFYHIEPGDQTKVFIFTSGAFISSDTSHGPHFICFFFKNSLCVCMHVCACDCICVRTCDCICVWIYMCSWECISVYMCEYICERVCVCVCLCVCVCVSALELSALVEQTLALDPLELELQEVSCEKLVRILGTKSGSSIGATSTLNHGTLPQNML